MNSRALIPAIVAIVFMIPATTAQTWVPPKGQGTFALAYQINHVDSHLFSEEFDGTNAHDFGQIDSQVLALGGQYGVNNRLTVDAQLAYVTSRYEGDFVENVQIDDGNYHGEMQDFRAGVRYMAISKHWNLTPAVHILVPTHNYETLGHTSVGRNLNELQLGLNAGKLFGYGVSKWYLQGNYTYSIVEEVDDIEINRSDAALEFGYFLGRVTLRLFGTYQNTHGGLDWLEIDEHDEAEVHTHDRAAASQYYRAGVGISFPVSRRVFLYGNALATIDGGNTHDIAGVTIGVAYGFQGALDFGRPPAAANASVREEQIGAHSVAQSRR